MGRCRIDQHQQNINNRLISKLALEHTLAVLSDAVKCDASCTSSGGEHRLYQADWLLRSYRFSAEVIATGATAVNPDLELDPKPAWALQHRGLFPLDVNVASREMLLRKPGFGTRTVDRIIMARRNRSLRYEDPTRIGALLKKARSFISLPDAPGPQQTRVSPAFVNLAGSVIWHTAPERLALLYQALWRLDARDVSPLSQTDPLGRSLHLMANNVGRDIHNIHAFVRFREGPGDIPRRRLAAWFEPEPDTLEPGSAFFAKRFGEMDRMIATNRLTAHFIDGKLAFGPGGARPDLPDDASAALWATYFAKISNPARIKLNGMRSEMPQR